MMRMAHVHATVHINTEKTTANLYRSELEGEKYDVLNFDSNVTVILTPVQTLALQKLLNTFVETNYSETTTTLPTE